MAIISTWPVKNRCMHGDKIPPFAFSPRLEFFATISVNRCVLGQKTFRRHGFMLELHCSNEQIHILCDLCGIGANFPVESDRMESEIVDSVILANVINERRTALQ